MPDTPRPRRPRARRLALMSGLALLASAAPAVATSGPTAQLTGGELFMGTTKVEAGARANGSFGSTASAPTGYHPRTTSGTILGFRVNTTECDWDDAGCVTQGDFFTPGSPYEAWGIQVDGNAPAYNSNAANGVAGSFASVDSPGVSAVWQSSAPVNGISVKQTYSIPPYGWLIDSVVELTNTTGATVNDVYFMRGLDPDNCKMEVTAVCDSDGDGVADGAGSYETNNTVVSQGSSSTTALVTATQTDQTYLGLRADGANVRVFTQRSGFANPIDLAALWSGTDPGYDGTVGSRFGDNGIYAVVRVPSIAPGATATVHVEYIVKEIPAAADFAETLTATGGLIDIAPHNGGTAASGVCSAPAHGTATVVGGKVRYTPAAGYSGTDTFTYSTGGPCGRVTVTIPAAGTAPKATAPVTALSAPKRTTPAAGGLQISQRFRIDGAGRYTFIYIDPVTGKRVRQLPRSRVGSRTLGKRYSAPVLVTRKSAADVTLVSVFGRTVPVKVRGRMALRIVLKKADGTLVDVTPAK